MKEQLVNLPIKSLIVADYCPRLLVHEEAIKELAENIKKTGVISPLHVRKREDGVYEVFSGSLRFRALKLLGREDAPCIIHDIDENEAKKLALAEAVMHEDHTAEELAIYIRRLLKEKVFKTRQEVAMFLGKSESWIRELEKTIEAIEEIKFARELQADPKLAEYIDFQTARELAKKPEEVKKQFVKELISPNFAEWARVAAPEVRQRVLKSMAEGKRFEEALKSIKEEKKEEGIKIRQLKWSGSEYSYEVFESGDKICIQKFKKETLYETFTIPKADLKMFIQKLQEIL